jgi:hypothetical protein
MMGLVSKIFFVGHLWEQLNNWRQQLRGLSICDLGVEN